MSAVGIPALQGGEDVNGNYIANACSYAGQSRGAKAD